MKKIFSWIVVFLIIAKSSFLIAKSNQKTSDVIYFYNWSEYVPHEVLDKFTKETGIKIIYSTYDSNESMYSKLKNFSKGVSYDLIVPSTYFVKKMVKEGMLYRIDKSKLSQFKNLDPNLLNKLFDPNNNYSVPYIWGATGIGVNSNYINPDQITSWKDFWNPKYKNQLLLIDDSREVFQVALSKLGYSGNTKNPRFIRMAYKELTKLMPNVMAFNADNPSDPFVQGEINLGMLWNGSAYAMQKLGIPIKFIWPKENCIFWMDNLSIPSNAKNKENALKLIDFLLRPDIAAEISKKIGYPTPNLAARKLLPKEISKNSTLYPDENVLKNAEWQNDVGGANVLYESYFQLLKASH